MHAHLVRDASAAAALILILNLGAAPSRAESYIIDKKRTEVRFVYAMGFSTQRGRFTSVEGNVDFDDKAPERARVKATIATASLTTGEPLVEGELKGRDFFNVEAQPKMVFVSRSVAKTGDETADMTGDMTVNGITKPVTVRVEIKPHDDPALKYDVGSRQFVGRTTIQRSQFNMTAYGDTVGDEVQIEIDAILRPKK